jgi:nucleoside diphosphate kinase
MIQKTLIGIKPDAFSPLVPREKGSELRMSLPADPQLFIEEVRNLIRSKGLAILDEKEYQVSPETARLHYAEYMGKWDESYQMDK